MHIWLIGSRGARLVMAAALCMLSGGLLAQSDENNESSTGGKGLPRQVDLRPEFAKLGLLPRAQGARDTCSLFAITALADFESARTNPAGHFPLSEEFLIWAAKDAAGKSREQAMFYEATFGLNTRGICRSDLMPYAAGGQTAGTPSAQALADAQSRSRRWQVHVIKQWDLKRPLSDSQLTAIKRALANHHPVACGLRWPKAMKGHEVIAVPHKDQVFDGHSIALVGYDDRPEEKKSGGGVFCFRNSDGPQWGEGGYGTLSYAYVRAYANDALWLHEGPPDSEEPVQRFEAESAPVLEAQGGKPNVQPMNDYEAGLWSGGKQLFFPAKKSSSVTLGFGVAKQGRFRLRVLGTAAPDFGKVETFLDGQRVGPVFDLYAGRVCPSGALELGRHDLTHGSHQLQFTAVGRNPASTGDYFGIDAIELLPPE